MAKKSKLTEKAARMPDLSASKKELAIRTYLGQIGSIESEPAKSQSFTLLLQSLFGVEPGFIEEYVQGIEKYLKAEGKDRILRGQADQLSGNLIIEFERDLSSAAKVEEAKAQLQRYTACAWSTEHPGRRRKFVCLASDGRRFKTYAPVAADESAQAIDPDDIELKPLEDTDATRLTWEEFYFFLDRYLLRKEILPPTSEHIVKDFGPTSHAFHVAEAALLQRWTELKDHPDYAVLYEAWDKYLRIVYGSALADKELFVRHTYLASLAKLMVWRRLAPGAGEANRRDVLAVLEGGFFKAHLGIENFLEEDFFSWVARPEARQVAVTIAQSLLGLLHNYHLSEISEDVLKALYEGLVDPVTRHDLGEYYTPDWLAHRIVRKLLGPEPEATVLDPACGSGTFLYMAIREKRDRLGDSAKTLDHICRAVVGMDIHPLACIVSKANYVLALGELMTKRKQRIAIPIYLANSIRPPELEPVLNRYAVEIDDRIVNIPKSLATDMTKCDEGIEAARDFALHNRGKPVDGATFANFLKAHHAGLVGSDDAAQVLFSVADTLKGMIEAGRDTIWAFVLKNIYKPLFLRRRFDLIVGNPPWLSYRYVERSDYQRFLKEQITNVYHLVKGRAELVTQMELGTLFLVRAVDLYLKPQGDIGFVLPKSLFSADQHDRIRRAQVAKTPLQAVEVWDLEGVSPLFNMSAAVYFGRKSTPTDTSSLPGQVLTGELPHENAGLDRAERALRVESVRFNLSTMGTRSFWSTKPGMHTAESAYKALFDNGACVYPRCFWFVDLKPSDYGFDADLPPLISSKMAVELAKPAYKGCVIEGSVESRFIYATLLPADMVPFGFLRLRPVVLPLVVKSGEYRLRNAEKAREEGFIHLADWLDKVQGEWLRCGGQKAKKTTAIQWLDYRRKLTGQDPKAPFRVVYATSGTHVCACVAESKKVDRRFEADLKPRALVADVKTFYLELQSAEEGGYIAAILNAPFVDKAIKPAQAKGLWGARDIHKKVLDLPIPKFDPGKPEHVRLAEIGAACGKRVSEWILAGGPGDIRSIGVLRQRVRQMLKEELAEIDSIVKPLLGL